MIQIVFTGGPCAGKTDHTARVIKEYPNVLVMPEVATMLFQGGYPLANRDLRYSKEWLHLVQQTILPVQISLRGQFHLMAKERGASVVISDREVMDCAAYLAGGQKELEDRYLIDQEEEFARTAMVIHFESLATGNPALYKKLRSSNPSRRETLKEAQSLEYRTREAWQGHPNWHFISAGDGLDAAFAETVSLLSPYLDDEIERKFVLPGPPPVALPAGVKIRQGYVFAGGDGEMRIREEGREHFITVKSSGSLQRSEFNRLIPRWVFQTIWPATKRLRIEKIRYRVPYGNFILEIDELLGSLAGRFLLECEFCSKAEANSFVLPAWAAKALDVTSDKRFKNASLARFGWPK